MKKSAAGKTIATSVDDRLYRDAMARLGAAVTIIATDGPHGRAGFTASTVCSVTDSPPTLVVCLNRSTSVYDAFRRNGVLYVNVLSGEHAALSQLFGGRTPVNERFAAASWSKLVTGSPVIERAIASFNCRVVGTVDVGTHDVLFCEVNAIICSEMDDGLFYFNRAYRVVSGR
jgi:flavin reductase